MRPCYISSICFWVFISAYVLFICSFNDAYYFCFLPSLIAGVASSAVLPLVVKNRINNLKTAIFGSIILHATGVGVSLFLALFTKFSHHFTYLTVKGYLVYIVLPAVLSLAAILVQQYLIFRAQKVKEFLHLHDKVRVALIVAFAVITIGILVLRPFTRIMVILMPF